MSDAITLRESTPADVAFLQTLYPAAFPDEDLLPLVRSLLDLPDVLSLLALAGSVPAGHAVFTPCTVGGHAAPVALLGPVAVVPRHQGQGIGGALIRGGCARLAAAGTTRLLVLGDPAYYGRHGFAATTDIRPPYDLPREWAPAWQSLSLGADDAPMSGTLRVPGPWCNPALWA